MPALSSSPSLIPVQCTAGFAMQDAMGDIPTNFKRQSPGPFECPTCRGNSYLLNTDLCCEFDTTRTSIHEDSSDTRTRMIGSEESCDIPSMWHYLYRQGIA